MSANIFGIEKFKLSIELSSKEQDFVAIIKICFKYKLYIILYCYDIK